MSHQRVGIDQRGGELIAVTVREDAGRVVVDHIETGTDALVDPRDVVQDFTVRIAIPDHLVMVKRLRLDGSSAGSLRDRVCFELTQSLLEGEDQFHCDYLPVDDSGRYLGTIVRREHLDELAGRYGWKTPFDDTRLSFQTRAIALGKGYLAFGAATDTDLTALVDLAGANASLCFLYDRRIVEIASVALTGYDLAGEPGRECFAADLRTVINYRLSTLFKAGVSVPLGKLLLCGEAVDDKLFRKVQGHFPMGVGQPHVMEGYFPACNESRREKLPLFLVALGLTVN